MAWNSKTSSWDWDNAVLFQGQAAHFASVNEWSNEGEVGIAAGTDVPVMQSLSSGFGPTVAPFRFGASRPADISSNDVRGHSHSGCLDERRSLEQRNSDMHNCASFSHDCYGGDRKKTGMEHRDPDSNVAKDENMSFLELRRQLPSKVCKEGASGSAHQEEDLTQGRSDQQGKSFLNDGNLNKKQAKEGEGSYLTGEEHGGKSGSLGSGDSLICLKLGKRMYFEDTSTGGGSRVDPTAIVTNSVPVKRPRTTACGVQTPCCQVEGCKKDLRSAKDYHRRHKVCEMHSKTSRVTVAGQEQRFCQQCSRFHVLSEFDEGKRSCRRRLVGHNERRRKPQPDPFAFNTRNFLPFQDDRRFAHLMTERRAFFHHPWITDISALWDDAADRKYMYGKGVWPRMMKLEDQSSYDSSIQGSGIESQLLLSGFTQQLNDRMTPLLHQSSNEMMSMSNDVANQQVLSYPQTSMEPNSQNLSSSSSGAGVFLSLEHATSQNVTRVSDSGRALSLLSSQLWCSNAPAQLSLDLSTGSKMALDQWIHEAPLVRQFLQGQQQQCDLTSEKLLSNIPHLQNIPGLTGSLTAANSLEKECHVQSFMNGANGAGNYEGSSIPPVLHADGLKGLLGNNYHNSQGIRMTIDSMHTSCLPQNTRLQEYLGDFHLGSNHFGELQGLRSYGFDSQQIL